MSSWIVVVNFNGWEDTQKCLRSLEALTTSAQTVLIDNASVDDHCDEIRRQFSWCHVVREPENGGWAGGNNAGIRYALERGAEQIILLNNDTTVSPALVNELQDAMLKYPEYGILGPVINHMNEPDMVMTDGCMFNRPGSQGFFDRRTVELSPSQPLAITEVDIVNGCCLMVTRGVCEKIGLVDDNFFLIHEESDFCLRAKEAGFKCGVINRSLVLHKGSSSFKRTGQRTQRYYDARNLRLLLRKHLGKHREGRSVLASYRAYFNYVFYRHAIELENGCIEAADAVIDGVYDGIVSRFGRYQQQSRRVGAGLLRLLFATRRKLTHWLSSQTKEVDARAATLR